MIYHYSLSHPEEKRELDDLAFTLFSRQNGAAFEYIPLLSREFNSSRANAVVGPTGDARTNRRVKYRILQSKIANYYKDNPIAPKTQEKVAGNLGVQISNSNPNPHCLNRQDEINRSKDVLIPNEYNIAFSNPHNIEINPTPDEIARYHLSERPNGTYSLPTQNNFPPLPPLIKQPDGEYHLGGQHHQHYDEIFVKPTPEQIETLNLIKQPDGTYYVGGIYDHHNEGFVPLDSQRPKISANNQQQGIPPSGPSTNLSNAPISNANKVVHRVIRPVVVRQRNMVGAQNKATGNIPQLPPLPPPPSK
jgi:hypothetical protein